MSVESTVALPSSILTTKQYEDQQAKLRTQEEDLDRSGVSNAVYDAAKKPKPS